LFRNYRKKEAEKALYKHVVGWVRENKHQELKKLKREKRVILVRENIVAQQKAFEKKVKVMKIFIHFNF